MTVDLRTRYLGLELRSPIVASSSPLTGRSCVGRSGSRTAGAGAVVLPSLFEEEIVNEEIELNRALEAGSEQFAEALGYFPGIDRFAGIGDQYLARLEKTKRDLSIPVIASLNAATTGGWVRYARLMQDAGADALELNLYHVAADPSMTAVDREDDRPGADRGGPAAVDHPAGREAQPVLLRARQLRGRAVVAGANGLVLFNRFYQPDLDLDTFDVVNKVELSHPVGAAPAAPLDRDPPPAAGRRRSASRRRPGCTRAATRSRRSWSAPTSR